MNMRPIVYRDTGNYLTRALGPYVHWGAAEKVHDGVYATVARLTGGGLDFAIVCAIVEELES